MPKAPQGKTAVGGKFIATERLLDLLVAELVTWSAGKLILETISAKLRAHIRIWDQKERFTIFSVRVVGFERQDFIGGANGLSAREISFLCRILLELNLLSSDHGTPVLKSRATEVEVAQSRLLKNDGWDEIEAESALTARLAELATEKISRVPEEEDEDDEEDGGGETSGKPKRPSPMLGKYKPPEKHAVSCLFAYKKYWEQVTAAGYVLVEDIIKDTRHRFIQKTTAKGLPPVQVSAVDAWLTANKLAFRQPTPAELVVSEADIARAEAAEKAADAVSLVAVRSNGSARQPTPARGRGTGQQSESAVPRLPASLADMALIHLRLPPKLERKLLEMCHVGTWGQLLNSWPIFAPQLTSEEQQIIREALDDKGLLPYLRVAA